MSEETTVTTPDTSSTETQATEMNETTEQLPEIPGFTPEQTAAWLAGEEVDTGSDDGIEKPTDDGHDADGQPETQKKEETPAQKKYRLKVDGEEIEVDETELTRGYSRAKAANKKFEEAASMRKDMQSLLTQLKNDPLSVLTNPALGVDFKRIAEDFLIEQLRQEQMTPEQRAIADKDRQLEQFKRTEEMRQKQAETAAVQ